MNGCWDTRETLLRRAANPLDDSSWDEFVNHYERFIYQLVRKMNFSHHDAEELVQDVFVKLWKKLSNFSYNPAKGRFRGWLCITTRNAAIDYIRKSRKRVSTREIYENDYEEICMPDVDTFADSEWKVFLSNQAWHNIQVEFEEKTVKTFKMISQGISVQNIAKELGISENSIYNTKSRIVKRMREEIFRLESLLDI